MRAGLLCLLGVMTPACGSSPDAVIRGAATCAECTIERYLLATIHDSAFQGGALLEVSEVFVTRDTTFFVLSDLGLTSELFTAPGGPVLSRDGGLWLAEYNRYRVEKWDRGGNLVDVIERETEWFPWPAPEPAAGQRFATLGGVGQDEDGLLWTHIAMRPRIERRLPDGGTRLGVDPDPSHAETIIEVFDPARRTLLASTRMAGWASYAAAGGFYQVEYDASPSGEPLIRVWAYRLRR
jgi:hypothetical protein